MNLHMDAAALRGPWPGARPQAAWPQPAPAELLAQAAHELKGPLGAVLGLAELLATDGALRLTGAQRHQLQHLLLAGRHLDGQIADAMDLGRLQADRLALHPEALDLAELATEALACTSVPADARGLLPRLHPPHEAVPAWADRQRARQVLINLLSNAVRHNRAGGQIDVRIGPGASITVCDTGPGLDTRQLDALGQPFERLGAQDGGPPGQGIGLALSMGLVQAMGGELLFHSTPGIGTLVTMVLPAAPAAQPETTPAAPAAQPETTPADGPAAAGAAPGSLLCIDDNPVNGLLVQEFFRLHSGLAVRLAATGAEGLALAAAEPPLAVLLDLHLPDLSGLEVLQRLRADSRTRAVPVAIVSGCVNADDLQQALDLGAQACWSKPLDLNVLDRQLADLLAAAGPA